jgi:hypothetical protein
MLWILESKQYKLRNAHGKCGNREARMAILPFLRAEEDRKNTKDKMKFEQEKLGQSGPCNSNVLYL